MQPIENKNPTTWKMHFPFTVKPQFIAEFAETAADRGKLNTRG